MNEQYREAMGKALFLANRARETGDVPVGAVVVDADGHIIGRGWNCREADHDPTGHAEIIALREASRALGTWRLSGCTLIVTLEPCTMCAGAILASRIDRVVFGAWDPKAGAAGSLRDVLRDARMPHPTEVIGGVLAQEAAMQLRSFFLGRRGTDEMPVVAAPVHEPADLPAPAPARERHDAEPAQASYPEPAAPIPAPPAEDTHPHPATPLPRRAGRPFSQRVSGNADNPADIPAGETAPPASQPPYRSAAPVMPAVSPDTTRGPVTKSAPCTCAPPPPCPPESTRPPSPSAPPSSRSATPSPRRPPPNPPRRSSTRRCPPCSPSEPNSAPPRARSARSRRPSNPNPRAASTTNSPRASSATSTPSPPASACAAPGVAAATHATEMIPARVITVSDRCSAGNAEDLSGPLAARLLAEHGVDASVVIVPDEVDAIRAAITAAVEDGARLVFTTGGTGLAPRDVTPEATEPLLATRIDGLADAIRRRGEEKIASAALSRGLVGVTARSPEGALVVNAPGSRGGVTDTIAVIGPLVAHIIDQLAGGDHPRA